MNSGTDVWLGPLGCSYHSNLFQRCSVGLMSGLCVSHSTSSTLTLASHGIMNLTLCTGILSYCHAGNRFEPLGSNEGNCNATSYKYILASKFMATVQGDLKHSECVIYRLMIPYMFHQQGCSGALYWNAKIWLWEMAKLSAH